jgi:hypothetical protein
MSPEGFAFGASQLHFVDIFDSIKTFSEKMNGIVSSIICLSA